jgi:hypothetical protein
MIKTTPVRPLLTARKVCQVVENRLGIPLRKSRLHKDSAVGKGPKPAARFGKQNLYEEAEALRYARSLISEPETAA